MAAGDRSWAAGDRGRAAGLTLFVVAVFILT